MYSVGTKGADRRMPARSLGHALAQGWRWLGALRFSLGLALAIYALTFRAIPGHRVPAATEPIGLTLAAAMIATASLQIWSSLSRSWSFARFCLGVDLIAVLGTLALYSFDPRSNLLILILAIQAEAGSVLGIGPAVAIWAVSSLGYIGIEALARDVAGARISTIDISLRILVGLVLAIGGGVLWGELSNERRRAEREREREVEHLKGLVALLGEAEQRYRALVEQIPALLYIDLPDEHQTPIYIGPRIEEMFGISRAEYLSTPEVWDGMVHPEDRERSGRAYADAVRSGRPYSDEYRVLRPDGRTVWVHDEAVVLRGPDGQPSMIHGVIFDITDRRLAEEREQHDRMYAEALHETTIAAMRRLEPNDVLDTVLARAGALVGTVHGYVYVLEPDGDGIEVRSGMGLFTEWIGFRMRRGEGMAGRVLESARPLVVDDYDAWDGRSSAFPRGVFGAVVGVPLLTGGVVSGVLGLAHAERGRSFSAEDVAIVMQFAEIATVAIDNANLYAAAQEEIRQRKNVEAELAHLAFHDRLTDLPNRGMFEEILELAVARAHRNGQSVAVLYLDLDNFKLINDSMGHNAGDEMLRLLAARLRRVVRETDAVARQGGDEFLLLLADMDGGGPDDDPSDAIARAEALVQRIRKALARPFRFNGTEVYVSASIGIAVFPFHARDVRTLLRYADAAMYAGKRANPGSTRVFSGEDPAGRLSLATRARKAVENGEFELHYQPIVDLSDGRLRGVEALIRWPQSDGSVALPGAFLPVIEEMGLIGGVGEWVLAEASAHTRVWHDQGSELFTSINLALPELWRRDLAARMLRTIHASGVPPSSMVIEITESAAMSDPERTRNILEELHVEGIGLAIDDFGTGYSSLSRVKDLPVDILKIDRPFLRGLPEDQAAAASVRAIVQLAHGLGMRALAEGIETEEQRAYLLGQGCTIGQGFLFSPAVRPEVVSSWIAAGSPGTPARPSLV